MGEIEPGQGYAVSSLGQIGDGPGSRSIARIDALAHRGMCNLGQGDAIVLVAGGRDGYVGRDGQPVGDNPRSGPPGAGD